MADWARGRLHPHLAKLVLFTLKPEWAALFGLLFLAAIMITKAIWQPDWPITRYDGLFLFAILTQVLFFVFRLETWEEVKVIFLFHLTGGVQAGAGVMVSAALCQLGHHNAGDPRSTGHRPDPAARTRSLSKGGGAKPRLTRYHRAETEKGGAAYVHQILAYHAAGCRS